jgi:hypothetical protein
MLETLLLRAVADEPAMGCVHQFIDCVAGHTGSYPSPVDKAKTIAYLASRPVIKQPLVGPTAQAGYWNFDHPAYDELKAFVQAL